jgi:hypothetical protein
MSDETKKPPAGLKELQEEANRRAALDGLNKTINALQRANRPDPNALQYEAGFAKATRQLLIFLRGRVANNQAMKRLFKDTPNDRIDGRIAELNDVADLIETGEWMKFPHEEH